MKTEYQLLREELSPRRPRLLRRFALYFLVVSPALIALFGIWLVTGNR